MQASNHSVRPTALLLGMFNSTEETPKHGQFRDRIRCEALEKYYDVYTLDNKHDSKNLLEVKKGRHCQASFNDTRRMKMDILQTWGETIKFDVIILDYFFSPVRQVFILISM